MFEHKKQLLHEVKVQRPNPQYAVLMQEQLGGGNDELKTQCSISLKVLE